MTIQFDPELTERLTDALGLRPYAGVASSAPGHTHMDYPPTPQLDKMIATRNSGKADTVQEFIDWMLDAKHFEPCLYSADDDAWYPARFDREEIMREFFGIDSRAVERERLAVLSHLRETTAREQARETR
jgi:hypothetical protein